MEDNPTGEATYCPEDNKLRLYVGRVPHDQYLALRAEGWVSTPKQACQFVATWTPGRVKTALKYAEYIGDEDQSPADRAADRAERFSGYRDKRSNDATGYADRYDSQPSAHGFQNQSKAERAAARHDRIGDHAVDNWSKAEYWQQRTAGVISHALYVSKPDVRMGRIKALESELRACQKSLNEYALEYKCWQDAAVEQDDEKAFKMAELLGGSDYGEYAHPNTGEKISLWRLLCPVDGSGKQPITGRQAAQLWLAGAREPEIETQWTKHYEMRLAYENQMLEAQGGRAARVEMIPGGFIGSRQIHKVNKSSVTGRVVSVYLRVPAFTGSAWEMRENVPGTNYALVSMDTERLPADAYRAPSETELAEFAAARKSEKAAAPKKQNPPLINPTDDDAERLQKLWNNQAFNAHCESHNRQYGKDYASEFKPSTVCRITQAIYSANSKGAYARAETRGVCGNGEIKARETNMYRKERDDAEKSKGAILCELRTTQGDGSTYGAKRVIVITDKPQKPLPSTVWQPPVVKPDMATK